MVFLGPISGFKGVFAYRKHLRLLVLVFLFLIHSFSFTAAQTNEYELKAVFLYNFTQFVSWPESAFSAPDMPFQLCLVGEDPFGRLLDETVTSERVGEHQIVVRRIQDIENTTSCHMIFIADKGIPTLEEILSTIKGNPILVVGNERDSAEKGAIIGFNVVDRRIRLRVNLRSARQANLTISSKLLKLSDVVEGD